MSVALASINQNLGSVYAFLVRKALALGLHRMISVLRESMLIIMQVLHHVLFVMLV